MYFSTLSKCTWWPAISAATFIAALFIYREINKERLKNNLKCLVFKTPLIYTIYIACVALGGCKSWLEQTLGEWTNSPSSLKKCSWSYYESRLAYKLNIAMTTLHFGRGSMVPFHNFWCNMHSKTIQWNITYSFNRRLECFNWKILVGLISNCISNFKVLWNLIFC